MDRSFILDANFQFNFSEVLTAQKLQEFDSIVPLGNQLQQREKSSSRRASYNALVRLKDNHARLKQLPEKFREQLMQENGVSKVPSDLVTMLMEAGGDLQVLSAQFHAKQEQENETRQSQKLIPMTEQQVVGIYGTEESKSVIAAKKASGMVVPDRNNPGKECYLMFQDEREVNHVNRSSASVAFFQTPICPGGTVT